MLFSFTGLLLGFSACGYKAPPYYQETTPKADKNVKFILQKKEFPDTNASSCENR